MTYEADILIIGSGPAGLAAAFAAKRAGAKTVIILERDVVAGGILNQCIHDGFGLMRYQQMLTGPEYAHRAITEAKDAGAEILTSRHVSSISKDIAGGYRVFVYTRDSKEVYHAKTVILATGCRERTRGNISIPGSRPAGVFTAGVVQNLVNIKNIMIGKRVVILGSGDIGLIMARRLTLEGARVLAVAEIMSEPTGLARNVSQCVYEFDIPIHTKTTVSRIIGKHKLEAVGLSEVDEDGKVIYGTEKVVECDALILSVGLIPENEVAMSADVQLMPDNSVCTDQFLQTNVAGIFSCGNSRHVMDLADYVSEQGELVGRNAVHLIRKETMEVWDEERTNCMKKGFPEKDTVTCILCPNGCQVKRDTATGAFSGNRCQRGEAFAMQEYTAPVRIVTTTVKGGMRGKRLIPVKTAEPVSRDDVCGIVNQLKDVVVKNGCSAGEIIYRINVKGREVCVVATADS